MKRSHWFLFLTIFIDMLGVGILIPILPQLLGVPGSQYFLLDPSKADLGLIYLGLLTASYPLAIFFASPVLGALSDKYGRRPILLISILGTALSYIVFGIAIVLKNIPLLFISRIVDGVTGGNIAVAQAAVADTTEPKDRVRVFGIMGAIWGIGFVLGPYIGGKLTNHELVSWFSSSTPFFFAAILSLLNVISIFYYFKETNHTRQTERKIDFFGAIKNITKARNYGSLRNLFLVSFIFNAGFTFFTSFFNVYVSRKFGFTANDVGNFFGFVGICIIFAQLVVVPIISRRFPDWKTLKWAYLFAAIGLALTLFANTPLALYALILPFAIPHSLQAANYTSLLTRTAKDADRGEVLGINTSVISVAQAIPPLIAGGVAALVAPWTPIAIAAVLIFIAGIVFRRKAASLA
ncbi:MAG: MFS transporter [Candidatus Pacebacteria bacterium]|nr:MFS transporter [Candidatus Paceibacterota bacterium]